MRDLSNPLHQTNLHLHYRIPYPNRETSCFFGYDDPEKVLLRPKDPTTHKPLTVAQMMRKKLRWMTLGGQYDWTRKVYPEMDTTEARDLVSFPQDIATLIHSIVRFFTCLQEFVVLSCLVPKFTPPSCNIKSLYPWGHSLTTSGHFRGIFGPFGQHKYRHRRHIYYWIIQRLTCSQRGR